MANLDRHAQSYLIGLLVLLEEAGPEGGVAPPAMRAYLGLDILEARQDLHHLIQAKLVRFSQLDDADQDIADLDDHEPLSLTPEGRRLAEMLRG